MQLPHLNINIKMHWCLFCMTAEWVLYYLQKLHHSKNLNTRHHSPMNWQIFWLLFFTLLSKNNEMTLVPETHSLLSPPLLSALYFYPYSFNYEVCWLLFTSSFLSQELRIFNGYNALVWLCFLSLCLLAVLRSESLM